MLIAVKRSWVSAVVALAIAGAFALSSAQSASAAWANWTGPAVVCAQSLTMHLDAGGTVTLHDGHDYFITSLSGDRAYGNNQGGRSGWVLNGWFYNGLTC